MSLGDLLLDYDNDGEVPCYGFGAIPKFEKIKSETVNHCFPITGDPEKMYYIHLNINFFSFSLYTYISLES